MDENKIEELDPISDEEKQWLDYWLALIEIDNEMIRNSAILPNSFFTDDIKERNESSNTDSRPRFETGKADKTSK